MKVWVKGPSIPRAKEDSEGGSEKETVLNELVGSEGSSSRKGERSEVTRSEENPKRITRNPR